MLRFATRSCSLVQHSRSFLNPKPTFTKSFAKTSNTVCVSTATTVASTSRVAGYWLAGIAGMTWGAIFLGGVTRLTESGLSMVNWHPFKELPPKSAEEWLSKYEEYKHYPEYSYVVARDGEMSLARFKFIWYMEWMHRQWGRAIGAAFLVPAGYFLYTKSLSRPLVKRVGVIAGLIGCQGLLGWFMVRSGLEEKSDGIPRVSHFRLCAHFFSATVIYSLCAWNAFTLLAHHPPVEAFKEAKLLKILGHSNKALMFTTLIWGCFVAGLDAGLVYNSWPKMADRWVPCDLVVERYGSLFGNLVNNPVGVQFTHRNLAYVTCLLSGVLWAVTMRLGVAKTGPRLRKAAHMVLAACLAQSLLGISALVHHVPVWLGALHQNGSVAFITSLLWFTHICKHIPK